MPGQGEAEAAARARCAFYGDRAIQAGDDALDDGQSQAVTFGPRRYPVPRNPRGLLLVWNSHAKNL